MGRREKTIDPWSVPGNRRSTKVDEYLPIRALADYEVVQRRANRRGMLPRRVNCPSKHLRRTDNMRKSQLASAHTLFAWILWEPGARGSSAAFSMRYRQSAAEREPAQIEDRTRPSGIPDCCRTIFHLDRCNTPASG